MNKHNKVIIKVTSISKKSLEALNGTGRFLVVITGGSVNEQK